MFKFKWGKLDSFLQFVFVPTCTTLSSSSLITEIMKNKNGISKTKPGKGKVTVCVPAFGWGEEGEEWQEETRVIKSH